MAKKQEKAYRTECTVFDGFSLSPQETGMLCATGSYGCKTQAGRLAYGLGVKYLQVNGVDIVVPSHPLYEFSFVPYKISIGWVAMPMISNSTGVYCYDDGQKGFRTVLASGSHINLVPTYLTGDHSSLLMFTPNSVWKVDNNSWVSKVLDGTFLNPCVYRSRIFALGDNHRICYSGAYDRLNFNLSADEGGYLETWDATGNIRRLLPLAEEMYVFFGREIYRLTGEGAARDFKLEKVAYTGGEIYVSSAAVYGDEVVFLAKEGMYKLKKGKASPFTTKSSLQGFIPLADTYASTTENSYIVPCRLEDGTEKMLLIDLLTGEVGYTKYSSVLSVYDGVTYGVDKAGRMFSYQSGYPLPETVYFESKGVTLGDDGDKTLKRLRLYGEGRVTLRVQGRGGHVNRYVELTAEGTDVSAVIKGRAFDFLFKLSPNTTLTKMEAYVLHAV